MDEPRLPGSDDDDGYDLTWLAVLALVAVVLLMGFFCGGCDLTHVWH